MLRIKEYCERVRDDAYGGSLELVQDGMIAMKNELVCENLLSVEQMAAVLEGYVDNILNVCSAILPLINMLDKVMSFSENIVEEKIEINEAIDAFYRLVDNLQKEQDTYTERIGRIGANLIADGDKVGTFSTSGTVMSILKQAVSSGKKITAAAFEARPHNEGYRTLVEISDMGIPVTFGVDALLCCLVPGSNIFIIGADAITSIGQVFAKTGSYCAALVCRQFGIPFYVAADTGKLDRLSLLGYPLKSSERPYQEVSDIKPPDNSKMVNISFELVPPDLIRGIITEKGIVAPQSISVMMEPDCMSQKMIEKIKKWL